MDIEIRLLRCAVALAEHGNFARAAKEVHLSQPSLSRAIQELESRLGVQLFSRNRTGVEPTAAGDVLLDQAAEVISRTADLVREMELLRGLQKGELSIAAGIYPGPMFVDRAVGKLIRAHPAARVSVTYNHAFELLPRLSKRHFDVAVVYADIRGIDPRFQITKLKPHTIYFVARTHHPLFKLSTKPSLNDILAYPITTTAGVPQTLVRRFRAARPKRSTSEPDTLRSIPAVACESLFMMKTIVSESDTVGLLPLNVVLPEIKRGTLAIVPYVEPWMQIHFSIVRLEHRSLSPLGERFAELVAEADAELFQMEQEAAQTIFGTPKKAVKTRATKRLKR